MRTGTVVLWVREEAIPWLFQKIKIIITFLGLSASGIYFGYLDTFPDISVETQNALSPFNNAFVVSNKGKFFELNYVWARCYLEDVKFAEGGGFSGITIDDGRSILGSLKPRGGQAMLRCPLGVNSNFINTKEAGEPKVAIVIVEVHCRALFWDCSKDEIFTWYEGKWLKGRFPNAPSLEELR